MCARPEYVAGLSPPASATRRENPGNRDALERGVGPEAARRFHQVRQLLVLLELVDRGARHAARHARPDGMHRNEDHVTLLQYHVVPGVAAEQIVVHIEG